MGPRRRRRRRRRGGRARSVPLPPGRPPRARRRSTRRRCRWSIEWHAWRDRLRASGCRRARPGRRATRGEGQRGPADVTSRSPAPRPVPVGKRRLPTSTSPANRSSLATASTGSVLTKPSGRSAFGHSTTCTSSAPSELPASTSRRTDTTEVVVPSPSTVARHSRPMSTIASRTTTITTRRRARRGSIRWMWSTKSLPPRDRAHDGALKPRHDAPPVSQG